MPHVEEIGAMEKALHPKITFIGYQDNRDHLLWDFDYTYQGAHCPVAYRSGLKQTPRGELWM